MQSAPLPLAGASCPYGDFTYLVCHEILRCVWMLMENADSPERLRMALVIGVPGTGRDIGLLRSRSIPVLIDLRQLRRIVQHDESATAARNTQCTTEWPSE